VKCDPEPRPESDLQTFAILTVINRDLYEDDLACDFAMQCLWLDTLENQGGTKGPEDPTWHVARFVIPNDDGYETEVGEDDPWELVWIHVVGLATPEQKAPRADR
jgi:hypothetical protein